MTTLIPQAPPPLGAPRIDCYRALAAAPELREDDRPTMFGRFAEFERWQEVRSASEGHFMERLAETALTKTVRENRDNIKVLFHHGIGGLGMQVLGSIEVLEPDSYYEVGLFDAVPPLIMEGLRAGEYGSSYRFRLVKYEYNPRPRTSDHNQNGIPELTILESTVREIGPTPLPVYEGATSGVRSLTDEVFVDRLAQDPEKLAELLRQRSSHFFAESATPSITFGSTSSTTDRTRTAIPDYEYRRSVDAVGSRIWALRPDMLATLVAIISERANGHRPSAGEIRDRIGTRADTPPVEPPAGVAVIPIRGPIIPRASLMGDVSGAASVEQITAEFRAALADPEVSSIVLDIDSPGGDAQMIPELAAEIRAGRELKPVVAVANPTAASGAYWLASAASEIVATPSGEVGSIGVWTAHSDLSAAQEKAGIKTTLVSAGEYKVERNPFAPLSAEAEAAMQERVDAIYGSFVDAVAEGRGTDPETVRADYGKGRTLLAPSALAAGMIDRVATLDQTLSTLTTGAPATAVRAEEPEPHGATTPTPEPEAPEPTTRAKVRLHPRASTLDAKGTTWILP